MVPRTCSAFLLIATGHLNAPVYELTKALLSQCSPDLERNEPDYDSNTGFFGFWISRIASLHGRHASVVYVYKCSCIYVKDNLKNIGYSKGLLRFLATRMLKQSEISKPSRRPNRRYVKWKTNLRYLVCLLLTEADGVKYWTGFLAFRIRQPAIASCRTIHECTPKTVDDTRRNH